MFSYGTNGHAILGCDGCVLQVRAHPILQRLIYENPCKGPNSSWHECKKENRQAEEWRNEECAYGMCHYTRGLGHTRRKNPFQPAAATAALGGTEHMHARTHTSGERSCAHTSCAHNLPSVCF